jgi:hypothetical protein
MNRTSRNASLASTTTNSEAQQDLHQHDDDLDWYACTDVGERSLQVQESLRQGAQSSA